MTYQEIADMAYTLAFDEVVPDEYRFILIDLHSWANVRNLREKRGFPIVLDASDFLNSEDVPF